MRLPVHVNEMIALISKVTHKLTHDLGREPTMEEVAREANLSAEQVREVTRASQLPLSLEQPFGKDGDGVLGELIVDHTGDPGDEVSQRMLRETVHTALLGLDDRERRVLSLRYGLGDDRSRTLAEVGKLLGLTRERIRQIEKEALNKLRQAGPSSALRALLS